MIQQKESRVWYDCSAYKCWKDATEDLLEYKSRGEAEQMIDTLKDVVEADMSYMQNEFALEGWMFINFIALHWYYRIYQLLTKHELNGKFFTFCLINFLTRIKTNENQR